MPSSDATIRLKLLGALKFSADADRAAAAVGRVGASARAAEGSLGALGRGATVAARGVNTVATQSGRLAAAGLGAVAAGARNSAIGVGLLGAAVGHAGSSFNAMQDSQRVAFTTLLGSQRQALAFMRQIQQLALDSPILDPKSTGDAARTLMAYGISARKVLPLVKALGDMSAASGKDIMEVMPQAALAIGQIGSKGKLQAQEMNQLAQSVGLSRDRIRKALGMTRDEFEATFTPGNNIKSSKAIPAILKAMQDQSKGAADRLSHTTQGRVARLKEVFARASGQLTRGLYDSFGDVAGKAADALQNVDLTNAGRKISAGVNAAVGFLKSAAPTIARGFKAVAPVIGKIARGLVKFAVDAAPKVLKVGKQIVDAFKPAMPLFKNVLLPLLKGVAIGVIGGIVAAFKVAIPVIKVLATVLGAVGTVLRPLRGVFQAIGTVIGVFFGGAILRVIGGLGRLGGAFRYIGKAARILRVPLDLVVGGFKLQVAIVRRVIGAFDGAFTSVSRFAGTFTGLGGRISRKVLNALGSVIHSVEKFVGRFVGFGGKLGKGIIDGIVNAIKAAPGAVIDAVKGLIDKIPGGSTIRGALGKIPGVGGLFGGHAAGGTIKTPLSIVGERGPELIAGGIGGRVYTATQTRQMLTRRGGAPQMAAAPARPIVVHNHTYLNGRQVHDAVYRVERELEEMR